MTSPEHRKEIYEYLESKGLDAPIIHKEFSKKLKQYGKIHAFEVLTQLEERIKNAINAGITSMAKKEIHSESYRHQIVALESMGKWVNEKQKQLNSKE